MPTIAGQSLMTVAREMKLEVNAGADGQHSAFRIHAGRWAFGPTNELVNRNVEFTALFCFNDLAAIGAIRALMDRGLRVPEDVSVVGFDDIQSAAFHNPSLTTIRQPLQQMGQTAARILLQRIRGQATFQEAVSILPELIIRESTCPPGCTWPLSPVQRSAFLLARRKSEPARAGGKAAAANGKQLEVQGVFGPILIVALDDVLASQPSWSHWEEGTDGSIAVFRYNVPTQNSHFSVPVPGGFDMTSPLRAYRGDIAVDPAGGAILRLTLQAITQADGPVKRADILVEYGPVAIAGQTWICPLRSVALASVRNLD
jgi:hypothetical protein